MLSIIINHYKSPEVLKLCLKYVKQNVPTSIASECIVTDSETIDKTELMMRCDFPDVKFLPSQKNIGFAKSVNKGLKEARGDYFLIINADVIIDDKKAVAQMLEYMQEHPEIGMLGPRLLNINGEHQPSCFRFYSPLTILARRTPFGKTPWGKRELARFLILPPPAPLLRKEGVSTDWLMGSALLVRKNAFEQVGGLCEDYFMYMEDVDWCRSFWEKGWKVVYFPEVFFFHYHFQASKGGNPFIDIFANKYTRIHILSAIKYFKKYGLKMPRYGI